MIEKKEKKRENELDVRMRVIRLTQHETIGDQFKYVRGQGLVKRESAKLNYVK